MRRIPVVLALLLFALPARAGLTVCNHTPEPARVALGYIGAGSWSSRGWWFITPWKCSVILPGPLNARYYYLYAIDDASGTWDGRNGFCVATSKKFDVKGRTDCASRGFDRKGFFQIDTGQAPDYIQTLSE